MPKGVYKHKSPTKETRDKISKVMKGMFHPPVSDNTKKKISKYQKILWAKEEYKDKMKKAHKGMVDKKHSLETRKKMSISHKGKGLGRKLSKETKRKMSLKRGGDESYNWIGILFNDKEYRNWQKNKRNRVIKRMRVECVTHTFGEWELLKKQYGYTCPCCKKSEPDIKLTEDHIIPLSKGGSDLIENIQPLCRSCNCKKYTKIIKY